VGDHARIAVGPLEVLDHVGEEEPGVLARSQGRGGLGGGERDQLVGGCEGALLLACGGRRPRVDQRTPDAQAVGLDPAIVVRERPAFFTGELGVGGRGWFTGALLVAAPERSTEERERCGADRESPRSWRPCDQIPQAHLERGYAWRA